MEAHVKYIKREKKIVMCRKSRFPVRGVSSFMEWSAGIWGWRMSCEG